MLTGGWMCLQSVLWFSVNRLTSTQFCEETLRRKFARKLFKPLLISPCWFVFSFVRSRFFCIWKCDWTTHLRELRSSRRLPNFSRCRIRHCRFVTDSFFVGLSLIRSSSKIDDVWPASDVVVVVCSVCVWLRVVQF